MLSYSCHHLLLHQVFDHKSALKFSCLGTTSYIMKLQPGIHRLEFLLDNGQEVHSTPPFTLWDITEGDIQLPPPGTMGIKLVDRVNSQLYFYLNEQWRYELQHHVDNSVIRHIAFQTTMSTSLQVEWWVCRILTNCLSTSLIIEY